MAEDRRYPRGRWRWYRAASRCSHSHRGRAGRDGKAAVQQRQLPALGIRRGERRKIPVRGG